MPTAAELPLPHLAMEDPAFGPNPWPHFEAARKQHPWLSKSTFGYVITEYEAMKDLLLMDDSLRPANEGIVHALNAKGTPWGRFVEEQILAQSGESHKRLRDIVAPMFTPRNANQSRELMRAVISQLLDEWVPKGKFDFEEFASNFPITVMCSLIGAPADAIPRLRSSMEALGLAYSMDVAHQPAVQEGMVILDEFSHQLVAGRRARGPSKGEPDLMDTMIAACDRGDLTERELCDLLIFLFVAGYDTSKNVLTMMMHTLINRPADYTRCADDRAFCTKVVEESLRYHSPPTIPRLTAKDVVYRGVTIPANTMLFFPASVIGRDPAMFPDANTFDPNRTNASRHMAFGRGAHICLGQFIARTQIEEGWHLIAQRIVRPTLAGPVGWRPFPGVWGIQGLPIAFQPAPPRSDATRGVAA